MTTPDTASATVTVTETGGVLTVTVGATGDNPTLSTTTSGGNIHVSGGGFSGDFAGVTQIHINLAQDGETPTFDATDFSFNAPVTITDTGGTGQDSITKIGAHNLTVTSASSYTSGTGIDGGVLLVNNGSALGTGVVVVGAGSELRGVGTLTMANAISRPSGGTGTISTAGTFTISNLSLQGDVNFGSTGNAGTVVVTSNPGSVSANASIEVAFGTLRNGGGLGFYTTTAGGTTVDTGATLSVNDQSMTIGDLFGTGAVTLGTKTTTLLTLSAGNFGGVISGAGHVQITGGTTLSGTNTYMGGTTINGGTLDIGNGSTTGSVAGNIVDNSALVFVRSNNLTYGGVISGAGKVTQGGTGVLSLTGTNTYSGGTTVHTGVLLVSSANALGSGGVTLDSGAELRTSGTVILNNEIDFASPGTSTLSTTGTLTVGSLGVQGNATFGSPGNAGTVVVTGFKSIANGSTLTVADGTLRDGGGLDGYTNANTTTTVNAGATLDLNDQNLTVTALAGNGKVTLGTNPAATLSLITGTFAGVISGAGRVDASAGTGGIASFLGANTYTGGTYIDSGILDIGLGGPAGSVVGKIIDNAELIFHRSNAYTFGGVISGPGTVSIAGGVITLSGNNTFTGGITVTSGVLAITNPNALGSNSQPIHLGVLTELRTIGTFTLNNTVIFPAEAATLSTTGTLTLNNADFQGTVVFGSKGNAGVVVMGSLDGITGTPNFDVAFGTLREGGTANLSFITSHRGTTTVEAGATLDTNGQSVIVKDLEGAGSVKLGTNASSVLTLQTVNAFGGVISGAGQVSISGQVTLTGANTYTGGTYIDSGILDIGLGGPAGSVVGKIIDNAELIFHRSNAYTFGGVISGPGTVSIAGGVITLSGNNTFTGGITVTSGVLAITNPNALGSNSQPIHLGVLTELRTIGTFTLNNTVIFPAEAATLSTTGTLTLNNADFQGTVIFGSKGNAGVVVMGSLDGITGTPNFDVAFGTLREGGTANLSFITSQGGTTMVEAGATLDTNGQSVVVKDLEGAGSVKLGTNASSVLTLQTVNAFGGVISGAGRVDASPGTGSFTSFLGANTYTGGTTVDPGYLQIGLGGTTGSVVGNIIDNAALAFYRNNAYTFGGVISGPGSVFIKGGVITLSGNNTFTGGITVTSGVLAITNPNALGSNSQPIHLGVLTELRTIGTFTLNNTVIFPAEAATLSTTGTLTLNNADFQGTVIFGSKGNAGVVVMGSLDGITGTPNFDVAFGTLREGGTANLSFITSQGGTTTVEAGATLDTNGQSVVVKDLEGAGSVTLGTKASTRLTLNDGPFGGVISGAGGVVVQSPGSVALTGANTYTGGTTISSGTLQIGAFTTTGSVTGNIVDNGTLNFARTNAVTFPGIISGTGGVDKEATGVLTLTGNNTYTGGTTLHSGTTVVNNTTGSGTGSGSVAVDTGATLGGKGTIAGVITVNNGGILAPGAGSPGVPGTKLHTDAVDWNGGGTFEFQLGATADELILSGALTKGNAGTYTIDLLKAGTLASSYTLMTFSGTSFIASDFTLELPAGYSASLNVTSTSLSLTSLVHGEEPAVAASPTPGRWDVPDDLGSSFSSGSDSPAAAALLVSPAPEPGSAVLLVLGGSALLGWRKR